MHMHFHNYFTNRDCLVLCPTDSSGFVHFLCRDLTITSFKAYEIRVSHFFQLKQQNILFTVGVSEFTKVHALLLSRSRTVVMAYMYGSVKDQVLL